MTYAEVLKKNNTQVEDLPAKIRKKIVAFTKAQESIDGVDESSLSAKAKKEIVNAREALVEMDEEIIQDIEIWLEKPAEQREAMRQKGLNLAKGRAAKNGNGATIPAAAAEPAKAASGAAATPAAATPAAEPAKAASGAATASSQNGTPAAAASSTVPASAAPAAATPSKKKNAWLMFGIVISVAFALAGLGIYQARKDAV